MEEVLHRSNPNVKEVAVVPARSATSSDRHSDSMQEIYRWEATVVVATAIAIVVVVAAAKLAAANSQHFCCNRTPLRYMIQSIQL